MNKILLLILLVFTGIGFLLVSHNSNNRVVPNEKPKIIARANPPISEWETFDSKYFNLQFRYPKFMSAGETMYRGPMGHPGLDVGDYKKMRWIEITPSKENPYILPVIEKMMEIPIGGQSQISTLDSQAPLVRHKDITIDGEKALVFTQYMEHWSPMYQRTVLVCHKEQCYLIEMTYGGDEQKNINPDGSYTDYSAIIDEVIGSIKFTN